MAEERDEGSRVVRGSPLRDRHAPARMVIDPGFVHHRKIVTLLGPAAQGLSELIAKIPPGLPEWQKAFHTNQLYGRFLVELCSGSDVPGLLKLLADPTPGAIYSSIERVAPTPDVYSADRVATRVRVNGNSDYDVRLEYSTRHIVADTMRLRLSKGAEVGMIAALIERKRNTLIFEPLLMGTPMIERLDVEQDPSGMWLGFSFGELYAEDIDEFSRVIEMSSPRDSSVMGRISESAFKTCIAELLGEASPADWGGEQSDLYTAHTHVAGERMPAAFLLKGPARFAPMTLNSLGKNNDQIVRLAQEPARLLIVQHCHTITGPVRATLRAFTIQPGTLDRRYCLIDGRDSLRILLAYGQLEKALALSGS